MSNHRALIVTHYWPPHVGGIERVAFVQAVALARRGWRVTVATSRLAGDCAVEHEGAIVVRRYPCWNRAEEALNVPVPLMGPAMFRDLVRLGSEADIIVAHGHAYIGSAYAAHAARKLRKPFVLIQHSPFIDYPFPLSAVERLVDRTLGSYVIRAARRVVAVSTHTERFVQSIAPKADTIVVRSGVDQDRFKPPPSRKREGGLPVILTVRRLVPRNGVDVLVRAWRREQLGDRAELVIAGDGPERSTIMGLAAGDASIALRGYVSDDELADLYRNCDVFVLPSRSGECFGLVAAEAMATGLPVIATESGGITDLVEDGVNGVLVPTNDSASLGQAIRVLIDDEGKRSRLSRGALDTASSLSWDRSLDQLEDILVSELT